ncbi:MAG: CBS domain-containing protein [Mesorhizobium sp.]|jgi:CBS domain-containing protein|nr:CBS domain-containing protein [Mesorhizobium sp.]MBL8579260.1 CBS domain-containing protein [Mesorhizobium sp.]
MLQAQDVMTREVIAIAPGSTVAEAAALMIDKRISAVPVVEDGRLVGLVSEGDLIHRAEIGTEGHARSWWLGLFRDAGSLAEDYAKSHSRRVADLMTRNVHTITEFTPVATIADLFDHARIKRVPVMRGDSVVGIVSRSDLMKAILATIPPAKPLLVDDANIRTRLLEELQSQPWATTVETSVEVLDGVVSFWGTLGSEDERRACRILAENIAGVRSIEDHRVVIDFPTYAL